MGKAAGTEEDRRPIESGLPGIFLIKFAKKMGQRVGTATRIGATIPLTPILNVIGLSLFAGMRSGV